MESLLDTTAIKMQYCSPNSSMSELWINHGISECFMDTLSALVIGGFLLIFGSIQLYMYHKYATAIQDAVVKSKLYNFQIFLSIFVPCLAITRFVFQVSYFNHGHVYGYMVSIWLFLFTENLCLKIIYVFIFILDSFCFNNYNGLPYFNSFSP